MAGQNTGSGTGRPTHSFQKQRRKKIKRGERGRVCVSGENKNRISVDVFVGSGVNVDVKLISNFPRVLCLSALTYPRQVVGMVKIKSCEK